ncbi:MAG: polysaccharide deacetylase family protein [Anaerolineae bacterium]|nr:polysaccharide deacetylase family protein [Anaerolineae bacterium]
MKLNVDPSISIQWPDGCSFALALSHDVDRVTKRWQFIYYIARAIARRRLDQFQKQINSIGAWLRGDDPYWNFERMMELEDNLGVRSTFFFMDERGKVRLSNPKSFILFWGRYTLDNPRLQQAIRELDRAGWEIGVHGSYHSYRDGALLEQEKKRLEAIVGHPIAGTRQHYLNLQIPETWYIHAQLGFAYDSTLGYANQVGLRWGTCWPFYPFDPLTGTKIPVLQIPFAIMDGPLMRCPNPWQEAIHLVDHVEAAKGVLTLDWHQRMFNKWEAEDYQGMYIRIIQECQQRGAWIVPLGSIRAWWQDHNAQYQPEHPEF